MDLGCSIALLFSHKGWLAIAKLKPLVEREFLSTNEKAWFPTVNNKLPLHYFLCVMCLEPMISAALVKCNEESNQLEEGPKVMDFQWLKTFPKSVLLKRFMNNEMLAESYVFAKMWTCCHRWPRGKLCWKRRGGGRPGGSKIGRDRWFAAEGSEKQGRVWPWRQMSSRNNTKVLCFNWSGLFRCCHKKSRQESRVGVSSGKSTLEELFTFALISIFSGAACEGGERGKELKRGA